MCNIKKKKGVHCFFFLFFVPDIEIIDNGQWTILRAGHALQNQFSIFNYQLSIVHCQLSIVNCQLSAVIPNVIKVLSFLFWGL